MFAAVGDSITDADSPDFATGNFGAASWATYVVDDGFTFAGGWAEWGATTAMMADSVGPIEADVLVVLAGTNDVAFGIPFDESAANLDRIVDAVGIEDVVIVSIPPVDAFPNGVKSYNVRLDDLAGDRGWQFVDASEGLRTADGRYRDGMTFRWAAPVGGRRASARRGDRGGVARGVSSPHPVGLGDLAPRQCLR